MTDARPVKRLLRWLEKQREDWLSIADGDSMDHATREAEDIADYQRLVRNLYAQAAGRWRPIKTAPDDATEILMWSPDQGAAVWPACARHPHVTHWMPLPAEPETDA